MSPAPLIRDLNNLRDHKHQHHLVLRHVTSSHHHPFIIIFCTAHISPHSGSLPQASECWHLSSEEPQTLDSLLLPRVLTSLKVTHLILALTHFVTVAWHVAWQGLTKWNTPSWPQWHGPSQAGLCLCCWPLIGQLSQQYWPLIGHSSLSLASCPTLSPASTASHSLHQPRAAPASIH